MKTSLSRVRQFVLFLGDIVCFLAGLFGALTARFGISELRSQFAVHRNPFSVVFIIWFLIFYIGGLYGLRQAKNQRSFFTLFIGLFFINAGVASLFFYFVPYFSITPKTVLFLDLVFTFAFLLAWRAFFNAYVSLPPLRLGLLGNSPEIQELLHELKRHPQHGFRCVYQTNHAGHGLPQLLQSKSVDAVAVALDYRQSHELQSALFDCIPLHIRFYDFVDFYELIFQKIPLAAIDRAWFLENLNEPAKQFQDFLKRSMDLIFAFALGVFGLLLAPLISLAILLESGRHVFYSQMRAGRFGQPFRIYKFRSMRREREEGSVTKVGRILRATHFDEIPQLINIIAGDMSFVGPRPEQTQFIESFKEKIPFYAERLLVRPGVTGWAQLHAPKARAEDALSKLQYDLFYVKHRSVIFDLEILLRTLRILVSSK